MVVSPGTTSKIGLGTVSTDSVSSETITSSSSEAVSSLTAKLDMIKSDSSTALFLPKLLFFKLFHKEFPMDEMHGFLTEASDTVTHFNGKLRC